MMCLKVRFLKSRVFENKVCLKVMLFLNICLLKVILFEKCFFDVDRDITVTIGRAVGTRPEHNCNNPPGAWNPGLGITIIIGRAVGAGPGSISRNRSGGRT